MNAPSANSKPPPAPRLASVDAYRGFVMFLMMAEVLHLAALAEAYPESAVWAFLAHHQEHVEWVGCTLHDLIQPSFSFLVGVALPFSIASRLAKGQSTARMTAHAFWRALVLVALGIFLRSVGKPQTNYTFEDTLTQIGLGYGFLFLLGFRPARDQWVALGGDPPGLLGGVRDCTRRARASNRPAWASPTTGRTTSAGSPRTGTRTRTPPGRSTPGSSTSSRAPRRSASTRGGYATLSFIPTLATMILGLIAGNVLRGDRPGWGKVAWFVVAGAVVPGGGLCAGRARDLPGREADLDAELGPLQRRLVLPAAGRLVRGRRPSGPRRAGRSRWSSSA